MCLQQIDSAQKFLLPVHKFHDSPVVKNNKKNHTGQNKRITLVLL